MKKISLCLPFCFLLFLPLLSFAKIYEVVDIYGNRVEVEPTTTLKAKGVFMNYNGSLYAFQDRYSFYFRAFPAGNGSYWRLYKVTPMPSQMPFDFLEGYEKRLYADYRSAPGGKITFVAATFFADLNGNGIYEPGNNNNPYKQFEFTHFVGLYINIADFKLFETIKNVEIGSNHIAYISAHAGENGGPAMPQLQAWFEGAPSGLKINYRLDCSYKRPIFPNQPQDQIVIPYDGAHEDETDDVWVIPTHPDWATEVGKGFFGGQKCKITAQVYHPNGTFLGKVVHPFKIGGENPQDNLCKQFIVSHSPPGTEWFAYAMAKHESALTYGAKVRYYNQFWESAVPYPGRKPAVGMPMHAWDEKKGPGGFGSFQVTGNKYDSVNVKIPRNQIWNWRANIRAGLEIVKYKRDEIPDRNNAFRWMNGMLRITEAGPSYGLYEGQRPQMREHRDGLKLPHIPVPAQKEAKVIFGDAPGLRLVEDAVNIKLYNGAEKHYCFYMPNVNQNKGGWIFKPGANYVKKVCKEIEE